VQRGDPWSFGEFGCDLSSHKFDLLVRIKSRLLQMLKLHKFVSVQIQLINEGP
jgi:hypothetical protein